MRPSESVGCGQVGVEPRTM